MPDSDGPLLASHANLSICKQCGGSGMLRLDDRRYRTCLVCLGQGKVLQNIGGTSVSAIVQGRARLQISLSASSCAK